MRTSITRVTTALVAVGALTVLAACGDDVDSAAPGDPTSSRTGTGPAPTELPGEPSDLGPAAGDVIAVVGIAHDDQLDVHRLPGADQAVVTTLDPLEDEVVAAGRTRWLPDSFWFEVRVNDLSGWALSSSLAYIGTTTDETAAVVSRLGDKPTAPTMEAVGRIVAGAFASVEPPSRVVLSDAPPVGDLGEITYDVIGLGDDSVLGLRLRVLGTPADGGSVFSLESVQQTILCGRGVTAEDRLCL